MRARFSASRPRITFFAFEVMLDRRMYFSMTWACWFRWTRWASHSRTRPFFIALAARLNSENLVGTGIALSPRLHLSYWRCIPRPSTFRESGRALAVNFCPSTSLVSGSTIWPRRVRGAIPPFQPWPLPLASCAAP